MMSESERSDRSVIDKAAKAIYEHSETNEDGDTCLCGEFTDNDLALHQARAALAVFREHTAPTDEREISAFADRLYEVGLRAPDSTKALLVFKEFREHGAERDRQVAERAWDRCVGEMPIDPDWKNFYSDQNPYTKGEQS